MPFDLQILGSNSSLPAYGRHHTCQYLNVQNEHFIIDCGEAAQYQLQKFKIKTSKVNNIFVSHLHGDHYLGLMGILFSQHLSGRENELCVFGQRGLDQIITLQLQYSGSTLGYPLKFIELNPNSKETIYESNEVCVQSFPLQHRIPCCGFLFSEKPKERRINSEKIPENFKVEYFDALKQCKDILDDNGRILYKNNDLTLPPWRSLKYAFCSDTGYNPDLIDIVHGVDILYHETTFLAEGEKWARQTFHSTTEDAARLALNANVRKLLIGHFSARYKDISVFVEECRKIFPETYPAIEGNTYSVDEKTL